MLALARFVLGHKTAMLMVWLEIPAPQITPPEQRPHRSPAAISSEP
jgi:hypothetical protein